LVDIAVGNEQDKGWNNAHFDATMAVSSKRGWVYKAYKDLNPANQAKPVCENIVDEFIAQAEKENPRGKILVRFNSDDFVPCAETTARKHSEVYVDHISGDHVLRGAPSNLTNNMGQMEYAKSLAGCAAGVMTKTGVLAFLTGPDQDETRRLFNSFLWGAQHCAPGKSIKALNLIMGFWVPIPGQTNDPQQLLGQGRALNADIFGNGIDIQYPLQFAAPLHAKGEPVFAAGYDHIKACEGKDQVCIGTPYFSWYKEVEYVLNMVETNTWKSEFKLWGPDWDNLSSETTPIGFVYGQAMSPEARTAVDQMVKGYKSGELKLFQGPVYWADGSLWVPEGKAPDYKEVWYSKQLIRGAQSYGK
jgi:simple sugar transport system substrate-binding protein